MNTGAVTEEDFEKSFEDVPTVSVIIIVLCFFVSSKPVIIFAQIISTEWLRFFLGLFLDFSHKVMDELLSNF